MSTEVGSLQASLSLDIQNFAQGIKEATRLVQGLGKMLNEALGNTQGFSALNKQAAMMKESMDKAQMAANNMSAAMNDAGKSTTFFRSIQQHTSRIKDQMLKFRTETKKAGTEAEKLKTKMDGTGGGAKNAASAVDKLTRQLGKATEWATDLKRILRGIVISQTFYNLLNIMEDLVAGSYQFMNNMDQAQISFSYLLGNGKAAEAMIRTMQDFAISSPLNTQNVMNASRKLMAMGFSAEATIPTMQILADTAAVFTSEAGGMSDMIDHVTLAIGQMKAAGKVMGQELRQLYNAGIPVFKILQEELGLTADQIRNIGHENISADKAIVALLTGLQKHYAGAAEAFTKTIPGALEVIKDSIFVINNMLFSDLHEGVKSFLNSIASELSVLVRIGRAYGVGGIFQAMFPPELHMALRNIIGSFQQLGHAIALVGRIIKEIFGNAIYFIVQMLSIVLPPITTLIHALTKVAYAAIITIPGLSKLLGLLAAYVIVMSAAKAFMFLWRTLKLGSICAAVANLVTGLSTAILKATVITKGWALALLLLIGILSLIALNSDRAKNSLQNLIKAIQGKDKTASGNLDIGFNPNDVAQPNFKPPTNDLDDYNNSLNDTTNGLEDVEDAAKKAGKAVSKNFVQSFDEVYNMRDESSGGKDAGEEALGALGSFEDALNSLMAQVKDFEWTGDFWKDLEAVKIDEGLLDIDTSGFGTIADTFWNDLAKAFTAPEWIGAGLGALIGGALGLLIGHPILGASIGALAGYIAGLFWPELSEMFFLSGGGAIGGAIGTAIGAVIGGLIGGPAGAAIGGGIGLLVGSIGGMLIEGFTTGNWNIQGLSIALATGIGAAIGLVIGGPGGALLGAAIGALISWIINKIIENWETIKDTFEQMGKDIATSFKTALNDLKTSASQFLEDFTEIFTVKIPEAIGYAVEWVEALPGKIGYALGKAVGEFAVWVVETYEKVEEFGTQCIDTIVKFVSELPDRIKTELTEVKERFIEWKNDLFNWVTTELPNLIEEIVQFFKTLPSRIATHLDETLQEFETWVEDCKTWLKLHVPEIVTTIVQGFKDLPGKMLEIGVNIVKGLWDGILEGKKWLVGKFSEFKDGFITGLKDAFGIHSPARTTIPIGEYLMMGISEGLTDEFANVVGTIGSLSQTLISALFGWTDSEDSKFNEWSDENKSILLDLMQQLIQMIQTNLETLQNIFTSWQNRTLIGFNQWAIDMYTTIDMYVTKAIQRINDLIMAQAALGSAKLKGGTAKMSVETNLDKTNSLMGHANGGIFNREHIARFAEDNKPEMIVPLQNDSAMRPFVDAIAKGISEAILPAIYSMKDNDNTDTRPLYVGTLIADDAGLKALDRKLYRIRKIEDTRR